MCSCRWETHGHAGSRDGRFAHPPHPSRRHHPQAGTIESMARVSRPRDGWHNLHCGRLHPERVWSWMTLIVSKTTLAPTHATLRLESVFLHGTICIPITCIPGARDGWVEIRVAAPNVWSFCRRWFEMLRGKTFVRGSVARHWTLWYDNRSSGRATGSCHCRGHAGFVRKATRLKGLSWHGGCVIRRWRHERKRM